MPINPLKTVRLCELAGTILSIAVLFLLTPIRSSAQSCSASCPQANGCTGTTGSCNPDNPDTVCHYHNPDMCKYPSGCSSVQQFDGSCCYTTTSPIIIDLEGTGFHLSDAEGGVWFRPFPASGAQYRLAWPTRGSQNGWLVLDRNGNGTIDDLGEMFGNETLQPTPPAGVMRNGFAALAVYDTLEQGGNGDGKISAQDAIFSKLRVWVDENRDGRSQMNELKTLESVGIEAISLKYGRSEKKDDNGNTFYFKGTLQDVAGGESAKVIYDVILQLGPEKAGTAGDAWPESPATVGFAPVFSSVK